MRSFIRHPSDIPIEVIPENHPPQSEQTLNNISSGGLCFKSKISYEIGTPLKIRIPLVRPVFEESGRVVWVNKDEDHYDIGVEFFSSDDDFKVKMIEQVCRIELYKKTILEKEGRDLSGRDAALEWISKYAESFQIEINKK